jgi:hypothetical protein
MKRYIITPVLVLLLMASTTLRAQYQQEEYLGLPGDNLNLYAVMKLFQESETLEGFERSLNDENSRINNLDLNGDGMVDYIRVIDNIDRNVHNIVLQVAINERERQDVAVFTVWREADGQVQIQLTGDEALYGRNYIIEPIFDEVGRGQTPNPGYTGNTRTIHGQYVIMNRTTTVEIAAWPLIRFLFLPTYIIWHSPWYYSYYPSYWRPWRPFFWDYYYGYHYNYYSYYYGHYRHWDDHRYPYWHDSYYSSRRSYSPDVHGRIQGGYYKNTYSHPEQRREGTAMYYKVHPDQNTRSSDQSSGSTTIRRSASETGTSRQSTSTGTNRQSAPTVTKSRSTPTETNRRSTNAGTDRSVTRQESELKSTGTRTNKQPASTGTNRRSSSTGTNRRSTSAGTDKSGRGTSGNNQSGTSGKRAGRTTESANTK